MGVVEIHPIGLRAKPGTTTQACEIAPSGRQGSTCGNDEVRAPAWSSMARNPPLPRNCWRHPPGLPQDGSKGKPGRGSQSSSTPSHGS
eukprot:3348061-Alexandrium_andersonii.AAC.1